MDLLIRSSLEELLVETRLYDFCHRYKFNSNKTSGRTEFIDPVSKEREATL
jgi:hypothetical protein